MQTSTEHQLALITKKAQALEEQLAGQIDFVKRLQQDREIALSELGDLRQKLEVAEKRAQQVTSEHEEASFALKNTAAEFGKAQLLQKRYRNAVAEQAGYCKAFVAIKTSDSTSAGVSVPGAFVLADECTINLPGRWQRSVCVDGALCINNNNHHQYHSTTSSSSASGLASTAADAIIPLCVENAIGDVIAGINTSVLCFGPPGQLKSSCMFGDNPTSAHANGLVQKSIRRLFQSLEGHRVTHFSMRMSMGEVAPPDDQFKDLLSEYSNVLTLGRSPDVRCIPVQGETEALSLIQLGMQRAQEATKNNQQHQHHQNQQAQLTHKFVVLTIENFDTRGHFRKGTMLFCDIAAAHPISLSSSSRSYSSSSSASIPTSGDQLWAQQSLAKFCDTIAYLAGGNSASANSSPNRPTFLDQSSGLMLLLAETLGGNSKTSMITCLDGNNLVDGETNDASDATVSALNTSLMLKSVKNTAMSFDVPAELQKLNLETESFATS